MVKVLLLILDGWGYRKENDKNAIALAKTPVWDSLGNPALLDASGSAVGLPSGVMGNSEVGHLTIGAGRVVDSDLMRINKAIRDGSFFKNKVLLNALDHAKRHVQTVHLMGLLSNAGVHSHISHLFALLKLCRMRGLRQVYIHGFLDGRDTPPKAGRKYVQQLLTEMRKQGVGELASLMGRYYAMDRDNRWNREHKAYDAMVNCKGRKRADPLKALEEFYQQGETDEFIKPTLFLDKCVVDKQDTVIFFNFRSDRARELTRAFVWGKFHEFQRKKIIGLRFVSLTQYDSLVKVPVAFPPLIPHHTLGEVLSQAGISQLRLAETEKWAHVTYFFNGLCECIFPHEKRIHISSRKVKTYEKTPVMKVREITSALLKEKNNHDFFVVNFANADMVAHSGNLSATKKAIESIDSQVGQILRKFPGIVIITADHGNSEDLREGCSTCHTTNAVPCFIVGRKIKKQGELQDIAPTVLELFGVKTPKEMRGKSLL